jgi:ankyrin repeat protein
MSLFFHIASNNKEYIKIYLSSNKSFIDEQDEIGRTNLYYAIAYGDLHMVKLIMSFNPLVNIRDKFGLTSIDYAYFYDKLNYTRYLKVINSNLTENDKTTIEKNLQEKIRLYGENLIGTLHTRDESDIE